MAGHSHEDFDREVAAFQSRLEGLLATHTVGSDVDSTAEAALLELETAAEELRVASEELSARGQEVTQRQASIDRDRQLMRSVFRELPLSVVLLDRDGRIRRVNQRTTDLLGLSADYLSGKPFPVFVDLSVRAVFRSQLAAVTRGQGERIVSTDLLRHGEPIPVRMAMALVPVPADPRPLVAAVVLPNQGPIALQSRSGNGGQQETSATVKAVTRRLDLLTSITTDLLGDHGRSEASALQASASRLVGEFADWALIDVVREGQLTRAVVSGPTDADSLSLLRALERAPVDKAPLPCAVIQGVGSVLAAHLEDPGILGYDERELPLASMIGAHSVLCVPITIDGDNIAAVTVLRTRRNRAFTLMEQATLQDLARLLAQTLQAKRRPIQSNAATRALRATRLPRRLPSPPDLEVAWAYRPVDPIAGVNGGFVDTYPSMSGWGMVLGEADGSGEEAASHASMVRHWIRLLGQTVDDPAAILTQVNAAMRRLHDTDQMARVIVGHLRADAGQLRVRLVSAGHRSSIVLRSDGRIQRSDGGGHPLNSADEAVLHADEACLDGGDCLLLYNGGLTDARNGGKERFEASALANVLSRSGGLPAQDVVDAVDGALAEFAEGGLREDATLLTVRFTG